MRILLAHNNFIPQGGAEVFYREVGRVLATNGHEVAYFSCAEPEADTEWASYFPEVPPLGIGNAVAKAARVPRLIYNRKARKAFARLIADFKPDIIHAFAIYIRLTPAILDAAREARVPVVLSCNDYKHLCPNYKLYHHGRLCDDCKSGGFYHALKNRCCHESTSISAVSMLEAYAHARTDIWRKNVACFLFASRFMAQKTENFWGKGRVNIDYLRNPFDTAAHLLPPSAGKYLLYFGRLIEEKGVDKLLDAAALAPDVPVVVVGDGPDYAALKARAESLPNVRVVGPAWGNDLKHWLAGARAVVVPSLWHENFPYVILQAFAAGLPVIGAARGGIPEMLGAGDFGWVYEATDATALATRLQQVQALPDEALLTMGHAAQAHVKQEFSDEKIYTRLQEIYQKVAA